MNLQKPEIKQSLPDYSLRPALDRYGQQTFCYVPTTELTSSTALDRLSNASNRLRHEDSTSKSVQKVLCYLTVSGEWIPELRTSQYRIHSRYLSKDMPRPSTDTISRITNSDKTGVQERLRNFFKNTEDVAIFRNDFPTKEVLYPAFAGPDGAYPSAAFSGDVVILEEVCPDGRSTQLEYVIDDSQTPNIHEDCNLRVRRLLTSE